ncbi:MAG: response regulator [Planctomycetaceae bacterium]|nr:response regulator [Planctomycetaceae bacterium]
MPSVLVVDDSLTVRMDLAEQFEAAGMAVRPCATLSEAREWLTRGTFGLVVLDVLLPDGDGLDLLGEIKAASPGLPVILLSSEAEVKARIRGLTRGADGYVGKPYEPSLLLSEARRLIQQQEAPKSDAPGASVLVIDDSLTARESLKAELEQAGYRVLLAGTGEEGLRVAGSQRPDAIIVDGTLPGIDGATVVRRLRQDAVLRRTPCLLFTGSLDRTQEAAALDAGADAFLRKDDNLQVVLARLAAALRAPHSPLAVEGATSLFGPRKLLLGVPDSGTATRIGEILEHEGLDVIVATTGTQALERLAVEPPACVLLDAGLDSGTGAETCRRIKSVRAWREIPVVLLTPEGDAAAQVAGMNAGADDCLSRSGSAEVLSARIRVQLRRRQFEEENRGIRERLLTKELEAAEARAARDLAETRAALMADLERKNDELAKANQNLAKEAAERKRLEQVKNEFVSTVSHELRTPLTSIRGSLGLLAGGAVGKFEPTAKNLIDVALRSSERLIRLINDILDIDKLEAGKLQFDIRPMDLVALVEHALQATGDYARPLGVRFTLVEAPPSVQVLADSDRLTQVMMNLLSNAAKFSPRDASVDVGVRARGGLMRVSVRDRGPGMPEEFQKKIFQRFAQADTSDTRQKGGTGLGLSISKAIIERLGGRIGFDTKVGEGTTFYFELPTIPSGSAPPSSS